MVFERIGGLILGQAVGDALGLPYEGLSPGRAKRLLGPPDRHRFLLGKGMVSDDTEHLCMTGQAVLACPEDPGAFARSLAWKLRWWLAALPAGTGLATLRAIVKLWCGFTPSSSGVFSAGNGPAMRAAVLGACFGREPDRMRPYVEASTLLTHTDPKAIQGALAVALAAAAAVREGAGNLQPGRLLAAVKEQSVDPGFGDLVEKIERYLEEGATVREFAQGMGLGAGVSGYMYHTVPVVLFAFLRHLGEYEQTLRSVIELGGDADTTGAIAGALAGAAVGMEGIPRRWKEGLVEWPRSMEWMVRLAGRLAALEDGSSPGPQPLFWPGIVPRNILFLLVVLAHGVRRPFPPW
ncbi:MAG: ADP-ribosylglycohydrolase family protein [bacterium]|nr:ADP-ribosylglycohydrolase family protein [bacterium]